MAPQPVNPAEFHSQ